MRFALQFPMMPTAKNDPAKILVIVRLLAFNYLLSLATLSFIHFVSRRLTIELALWR
jgi:hypothetical protein